MRFSTLGTIRQSNAFVKQIAGNPACVLYCVRAPRLEIPAMEVPDMRFEPKGLPVLIAVTLVVANYALQFFPSLGVLATTNLLLHLGIVAGLLSLLIGDSL